jgi:hypothetical protein
MEGRSGKPRYGHLFACISQDVERYTVQVRLYNQANRQNGAHGEKWADTFAMASMSVAALAAELSIPQARIKTEILMQKMTAGTRHWHLTAFHPSDVNVTTIRRCYGTDLSKSEPLVRRDASRGAVLGTR